MSDQNQELERLKEAPDEILFSRFKRGDQQAFDLLIKRYQGPIFALIIKSVRNHAQAEDLFQDVFFKVIEKRDQFRENVSFRAWLYTITRNTCIDRARKFKRTPPIDSIFKNEERPLEVNIAGHEEAPDTAASGAELDTFLSEAMEVLPAEQRETFYLKVKGELTFEEIGETMKCSVNTAKSRMRYALERLREIFKKRGYLK